jgi:hypothetical protein
MGFWIENRSGTIKSVTLVGVENTADRQVTVGSGWQLLGSTSLNERILDEANISATGTDDPLTADRIVYWDAPSQSYQSAWYCGGPICESWGEPWANHWLANDYSPSEINLLPGHGFWYENRHSGFTWTNPWRIEN